MKRVLVLTTVLWLLAACSTVHLMEPRVQYGIEKIDAVQYGVTTKRGLVKAFGMPTRIIPAKDGELWNWQYPPGNADGVLLFEVFIDTNGKVGRITRVLMQ
jgi:hypothetical protein